MDHRQYFPNKFAVAYDGDHQLYTPKRVQFPDGRPYVSQTFFIGSIRNKLDRWMTAMITVDSAGMRCIVG